MNYAPVIELKQVTMGTLFVNKKNIIQVQRLRGQ